MIWYNWVSLILAMFSVIISFYAFEKIRKYPGKFWDIFAIYFLFKMTRGIVYVPSLIKWAEDDMSSIVGFLNDVGYLYTENNESLQLIILSVLIIKFHNKINEAVKIMRISELKK